MKIKEVIGVIVFQCGCGQEFVANTELIRDGVQFCCPCGGFGYTGKGTGLAFSLNPGVAYSNLGNLYQKEYDKHIKTACAVPMEEYKKLLSEFIVTGKKPKVKKQNQSAVSFDSNAEQIQLAIEALMGLGFGHKEAVTKVQISVKEGLYMHDEIIKKVLMY
jgi:hypothetical protein